VTPLAPPQPVVDRVSPSTELVVVGAGVMGSWTAYLAASGGRQVTLLDAWGAGNPRATSGDESRISRAAHGSDRLYTRWSRRAREAWLAFADEWQVDLWVPTGVLWFASGDGAWERSAYETLVDEGVPVELLDGDEICARWPQARVDDGVGFALYEPEGGALRARRACQSVSAAFQRRGGSYALAAARPGRSQGGRLLEVVDATGHSWSGEEFVFACGPWLPRVFPDVAADLIRVTKQDVLYLGVPAGDRRWDVGGTPAWCDYTAAYYGLPSIDGRGFKVAPDRYGPIFDPSHGERVVDAETLRLARSYLARRFPVLAAAPVVEGRVCQYETTPDGNFVLDRHPEWSNVWLAGGGSGHGFKHGPRIGEYLLARIDGASPEEADGADAARFVLGPRQAGVVARTGGDSMARTWELF